MPGGVNCVWHTRTVCEVHSYGQAHGLEAEQEMSRSSGGRDAEQPLPPGLDLLWGRRERGSRGPQARAVGRRDRRRPHPGRRRRGPRGGLDGPGGQGARLHHDVAVPLRRQQGRAAAADVERQRAGRRASWCWRATAGASGCGSWAVIQRTMLDRHPWITQMPMAAPPLAPNSLAFVETGLEALDGTGLADADKLRVIGLLSSYTLSEARMANDAARAAQAKPDGARGGEPRRAGPTRRCCASWSTSRPTRGCTGSPGPRRSGTTRPATTSGRSSCSASTASWTASRP